MSAPSADLIAKLKDVVGQKGWRAGDGDLAPYLSDERGLYTGKTELMVMPGSVDEVAKIITLCAAQGVAIVPQGGNTGLTGAGVPFEGGEEILLNLSRMNRIFPVDASNAALTCEAGAVLADIKEAAWREGFLFPLSLGAEGSCQIGGNIATNAGGVEVLKYGMAKDLVLGLEVVLSDGRILDMLTPLRKNNTGYDLKQLFMGAEGTLGVITAASLKLFPRPKETITAFAAVETPEAARDLFVQMRTAMGESLSAFEFITRSALELALAHIPDTRDPMENAHPHYALMEFVSTTDGSGLEKPVEAALAGALEEGHARDAVLASSQAQAANLWRLRENLPEAQKKEGGSIKHDISVPLSAIPQFLGQAQATVEAQLPGVRVIAFGHMGDGNIHFNLTQPREMEKDAFLENWAQMNRIVHDIAVGLGGSFSAEHGIGRLKRDELRRYKSDVEMELMRTLKNAIDPENIMNPGKVI